MATNLVTVEKESEYLFQEESKVSSVAVCPNFELLSRDLVYNCCIQKSLAHLLETLYVGLLTQREVTYCINECNMLNVKLYSSLVSPPVSLRDYDVPVLVFQVLLLLSPRMCSLVSPGRHRTCVACISCVGTFPSHGCCTGSTEAAASGRFQTTQMLDQYFSLLDIRLLL